MRKHYKKEKLLKVQEFKTLKLQKFKNILRSISMMYGKRVFKTLAVLFMLFGLVGCGGSGGGNDGGNDSGKLSGKALTSVSELDYFPDSNITGADEVEHTIIRYYKSETDRDTDRNTFKNKYNVIEKFHRNISYSEKYYPLGAYSPVNRVVLQAGMLDAPNVSYENPYYNRMTLDTIGDTIKRDDALFEGVFEYKGGMLMDVDVLKTFDRNVTAELKAYGELLERDHDFYRVETGTDATEWQKIDNDYIYGFGYAAALYDPFAGIVQTALWSISADLY
jgi:hypothetical protein